jgi:SAM-dependent methyltransferase
VTNDYRADLAYIHHAGFSDFSRASASGVVAILAKHGIRGGLLLDVGCGTGVLARELTRAGFEVRGFDASPAMIELARRTAPEARFEVGPFETVELPPCDAIVAMGEVLSYGDIRPFLPRAASALRKDGMLLFDVAERGSYPAYDEQRIGGDDWSVIAVKESDGTKVTRRVLTFRNEGGQMRRDEEVHELALYDREELLALLRGDFRVRVRRSYGSRRLPKGHMVYVCVRR